MRTLTTFLVGLVCVTALAACGGSSSSSSSAVTTKDELTTPLASAARPALLGGSFQQSSPLVLASPVANNVFSGGEARFLNYSAGAVWSTVPAYDRPLAMATDGANLYVADYYNDAIRRVNIATKRLETVAGKGVGGVYFNRPSGVAYAGGSLYVTDSLNYIVRKIDLANNNTVTPVAGASGQYGYVDSTNKDNVRFGELNGITSDGISLFVTDDHNTIRRIVIATGAVTTLAGSPNTTGTEDKKRTDARFNQPTGITTDGTNLFVTDWGSNTIRKMSLITGDVTTIAGSPGPGGSAGTWRDSTDGTGETARFNQPNGITCDGPNLYVTDSYQNKVRKIVLTPSGFSGAVTTLATVGAITTNTIVGITTNGASLFITDISADNSSHVIRELK